MRKEDQKQPLLNKKNKFNEQLMCLESEYYYGPWGSLSCIVIVAKGYIKCTPVFHTYYNWRWSVWLINYFWKFTGGELISCKKKVFNVLYLKQVYKFYGMFQCKIWPATWNSSSKSEGGLWTRNSLQITAPHIIECTGLVITWLSLRAMSASLALYSAVLLSSITVISLVLARLFFLYCIN